MLALWASATTLGFLLIFREVVDSLFFFKSKILSCIGLLSLGNRGPPLHPHFQHPLLGPVWFSPIPGVITANTFSLFGFQPNCHFCRVCPWHLIQSKLEATIFLKNVYFGDGIASRAWIIPLGSTGHTVLFTFPWNVSFMWTRSWSVLSLPFSRGPGSQKILRIALVEPVLFPIHCV